MATLSDKIDLARALFGTNKTDAPSVNRISGTATANSENGTVTVQLEDGDVVELGTIGSVRSGQTVTIHVQGNSAQVVAAEGWGDALQDSVDEAVEVANATGQHFWEDTNGAHVTEVTREEWEDTTGANYHAGYNSLWNSLGLLFRKALNNLVAITQSAVTFYDGSGNNAANVTASFGSSGAQVGRTGESHMVMDYRSMALADKDGTEYFAAGDMRDSTGYASMTVTFVGDGSTTTFRFYPAAASTSSITVSVSDSSGGTVTKNTAYVQFSTAPTDGATITVSYTTTSGYAKGYTLGIRASGSGVGGMSVAEGLDTIATGYCSHAEGYMSAATGVYSHASGYGALATGANQTAIGQFNAPDPNALLIVGRGTYTDNRLDAFKVRRDGKVYFKDTTFENMFVYETVDSGTIPSIAGNSTKWVDAWSVEKTGYKAISIAGYYINGATTLSVYCMRFSDATHVQFAVRNNSSTATSSTGVKIEATILYVKVL